MTSEYVSIGHPDKVADYISEYILDRYIEIDPHTRYALEVQIKDNFVSLAGEITSRAVFTPEDKAEMVKQAVASIGYTHEYALKWGDGQTTDASKIEVVEHISQQSPDIAQGVDSSGWGDQGIFWGYAEPSADRNYMPLDWWLARGIAQHLLRCKFGGIDIKTQITVNGTMPTDCVIAIPCLPECAKTCAGAVESYARSVLGSNCNVVVNGTGSYVRHGSAGDCGTTGRKLAVDFYGGNCPVGGGSPWTKDGTKADLALNLLARELAVQQAVKTQQPARVLLSTAIGKNEVTCEKFSQDGKSLGISTIVVKPEDAIKKFKLDQPLFAKRCREGLFTYV